MTRMSWNNPPDMTPESIERAFKEPYSASYYATGNYANYAERRDRYLRTAAELSELLERLSLLRTNDTVLDYGCGPGYLIEGLRARGYSAGGVEVSEWARDQAAQRGLPVVADPFPASVMLAMDVFEHMTDEQVREAIRAVTPRVLVARIPVSTDGGATFHLAVSRNDVTHINCKTKERWEAFLADLGYLTMRLSLYTVYDSPGVAALLAVRR